MELSSCADYNGKLIISKLASFNTLLYEPLCVDWATKLSRKKLCIEVLVLKFIVIGRAVKTVYHIYTLFSNLLII